MFPHAGKVSTLRSAKSKCLIAEILLKVGLAMVNASHSQADPSIVSYCCRDLLSPCNWVTSYITNIRIPWVKYKRKRVYMRKKYIIMTIANGDDLQF